MPRTKTTRNPFGTILKKTVQRQGKKVTVFDARKRYRDAEGTPKEKTKRCLSHSDAMIALENFANEIKREGLIVPDAPHSFFELVEYFKAEYVKPATFSHGRQISGYRQNLDSVKRILDEQKTLIGDLSLPELNYEHIRLYAERISTTLTKRDTLPAVSTVNQKLTILRRVLNVGIQLGWIDVNPFRRGKRLIHKSAEARRNRMLTFDEEVRLLAACTGRLEYLRAWIICALDTAMRRGDIWNLRWQDIDFADRVIYIGMEQSNEIHSKTGVAGVLPVTPRLFDELQQIKSFTRYRPADLVFGKIDYKKGFARVCENAGISNLQFRDLRSTGATRMLLAGNANALVRKITRHTGDDMLIAHYTNIDVENARLIGQKLAEFTDFQLAKVKSKVNEKSNTA